jgi:hypothetical protein
MNAHERAILGDVVDGLLAFGIAAAGRTGHKNVEIAHGFAAAP